MRQALYDCVLPALTLRNAGDTQSLQAQLYYYMNNGDLETAMKVMKALIADVPYSNKKMASMDMEDAIALL